jgi:NADH dehydrogenase (ubiquinone) Fe-S protein 1
VNILHRHTGQVSALDIGYRAGFVSTFASAHPQLLYLCGADELSQLNREQLAKDGTFVVYQGHHGDAGAELADVVFPGAAYTEKDATYVNTEGTLSDLGMILIFQLLNLQVALNVPTPPSVRRDWRASIGKSFVR